MSTILIKQGTYRNQAIVNQAFELVEQFKQGKKSGFVTVKNGGTFPGFPETIRVSVERMTDYEFVGGDVMSHTPAAAPIVVETDDEIIARIRERFSILDDMTDAAARGDVRAMIVSGPPGVGKSFGVEARLARVNLMAKLGRTEKDKCEFISGACTPISLYKKLYEHKDPKHVVVFDDTDSIFYDDDSLNILKAALDTGKRRTIAWLAESRTLRDEDIPPKFDFQGSVIFITNIKLETVRGKIKDHVTALFSRCHYLDLTMDNDREKLLRIKQVAMDSNLFADNDLSQDQGNDVISFIEENQTRLRELSIRTLIKCAELRNVSDNWKRVAQLTILR
jgi:hypothetical protein